MSFERTIQMENHIILPVFGQFDANIKKIEKACGVSIVNRGDDVKISGEERDVHKAWNILHSLVALVKKGEEITEQNLEYFISSAEETDLRELDKERQHDHKTEHKLCSFSGNGTEKRSSHRNRQRFYL